MTAKELVKKLMSDKGISNAEMAHKLQISQAAVWDRLNPAKTNNMTVNKLNSFLRELDYELVVLPRGKAGRIDGAIVVSDSEKAKSAADTISAAEPSASGLATSGEQKL